eukprot:500730_1
MSEAKSNVKLKNESIQTYSHSTQFKTAKLTQCISLLSWNIIHKDFVDPDEGYGAYATADDLDWIKRLPKIKNKLVSTNADIICLQEVDKNTFANDIGNEMKQKHNYSFIVNIPKKSKVDFTVAIMYKSSKFECKYEDRRARALILLLTNKLDQTSCPKCINSKTICIYHSFFVVSVHLDSARGSKNNELTRINQIKSVLKRINYCITQKLHLNISDEIKNIRIILVGDFNTFYECDTAQMLLQQNNMQFQHKFEFKEVYSERIIDGDYNCHNLPPNDANIRIKYFPTYCAVGIISAIDLMFYTKNNLILKGVIETVPDDVRQEIKWDEIMEERITEWKKTKEYKLFWPNNDGELIYNNNNICNDILLLPNKQFPSDHLPIAAVFEFKNICHVENDEKCRCSIQVMMKKKQNKKSKNNHKNKYEDNWKFYEMNSF